MPEDVSKLTPHNDGRRRRMYMKNLSAVAILPDVRGANPEANVTFFKSAEKQRRRPGESDAEYRRRTKKVEKAGDLVDLATSMDAGHQHGISLSVHGSELSMLTTFARTDGGESHDHLLVRNGNGSFSVLENAGHTHGDIPLEEVQRIIMSRIEKAEIPEEGPLADLLKTEECGKETVKEENAMTEQEKQELEALKAENTALKAVLRMTPAHKAHYDTLDATDQESFAKMGSTARDVAVKAAEEANPEVFKSTDGTVYRQNDDPRLVAMAKERDEDRKETLKLRALTEDNALAKRAGETLANTPGDVKVHKAMLKAFDAIEDEEVRTGALDALKAGDIALAKATTTHGTSAAPKVVAGQDVAKSANDELQQIADDFAKADSKLTPMQALEKAYDSRPDLLQKAVAG